VSRDGGERSFLQNFSMSIESLREVGKEGVPGAGVGRTDIARGAVCSKRKRCEIAADG